MLLKTKRHFYNGIWKVPYMPKFSDRYEVKDQGNRQEIWREAFPFKSAFETWTELRGHGQGRVNHHKFLLHKSSNC